MGFHGHQNLSMGVANSVLAYQAGAKQIDGALCALGAGAGNSPTEVLAATFERILRPADPGSDTERGHQVVDRAGRDALDLGLHHHRGQRHIDATSGFQGHKMTAASGASPADGSPMEAPHRGPREQMQVSNAAPSSEARMVREDSGVSLGRSLARSE